MKNFVGKKIRQRRKELGWSQAQLAKASGHSRLYVLKLENEQIKNPGIESIKKIFRVLGLKLDLI